MIKRTRWAVLFILGVLSCAIMHAQEKNTTAKLHVYRFSDGATIRGMADNGLWATAYGPSAADGTVWDYARLINLTTDEVTLLVPEDEAVNGCAANDVTNDGSIVAGSYNGAPAVWMPDNGWVNLPTPAGWSSGEIRAITPDGRLAVGNCILGYTEVPVLWDLNAGGVIIETPNYPQTDMSGTNNSQTRFINISADGKHVMGCVSYSYPGDLFYFIYHVETKTWEPIGFDFNEENGLWTAKAEHMLFIENAYMSPNYQWMAGTAYMVEPIENSVFGNEFTVPFVYDVANDTFTLMTEDESHNMSISAVDNEGTLYGATPFNNPVRTLYIRNGLYWIPLSEIMSQLYDMDYYSLSGFEHTGTTIGASTGGNILSAIAYPNEENYALVLNESFSSCLSKINLLKKYTPKPTEGTRISTIRKIQVLFDRRIAVAGATNCVDILDEDGNVVRSSVSVEVSATDSKTLDVQFRSTTLEPNQTYSIRIPAGAIHIYGDNTHCNEEIRIAYTGRDNVPVCVNSLSPTYGNALTQINYSTNPVVITFDTDISLTDSASAVLYQDGELLADLSLAILDDQLAVYPATTLYLYKDTPYRIVIKEGSVTDVVGNNPNEEIEVEYVGSYVREVVSNDTVIYREDFNGGVTKMLLYDGDQLTPNEEMTGWKFTSSLAWHHACDEDNYTDQSAVSHSMYETPGTSDDWMVTPKCYIPDGKCYLKFQSQSYKKGVIDSLKVMVLASNEEISVLTDAHIARFREEGVVVYHEQESPGNNESYLVGDWKQNSISLRDFEGKSIYVAFINENTDGSAIFVNNLEIVREVKYAISLNTSTTVVQKEEETVSGRIQIKSEDTFGSILLRLMDRNDQVISEIQEDGLSLSTDDIYEFTFPETLPLVTGEIAPYKVWASLDGERDSFLSEVQNLVFEPYKRVCVEKYTGMDCPNCPAGIVAMEHLQTVFGERIIPIEYHTYTGDFLESGLTAYTKYLGLAAAPTAVINRGGTAISPLKKTSFNGVVDYTFHSSDGSTWLSAVETELQNETNVDIEVEATYNADTKVIDTHCSYKFALNMEQQNISLLLIVTEDDLDGYQTSNLYEETDTDLGEWAAGGKYAKGTSLYTFRNVARSVVGSSNIGTSGLVPSEINAGETYSCTIPFNLPSTVSDIHNCHVVCMMIDANTGKYINAATCAIVDPEWDAIQETTDDKDLRIQHTAEGVLVSSDTPVTVELFSANGVLIGTARGETAVSLPTSAYKGILIVRATNGNRTLIKKIHP